MPYRGVDYKKSARFHPKVSLVWYAILRASGTLDAIGVPSHHTGTLCRRFCNKDVSFTPSVLYRSSVCVRIDDFTPIKVTAIKCHDQHLCGCDIGGNGNVLNVTHSDKLLLSRIVFRIGTRISEADKHVYLVI